MKKAKTAVMMMSFLLAIQMILTCFRIESAAYEGESISGTIEKEETLQTQTADEAISVYGLDVKNKIRAADCEKDLSTLVFQDENGSYDTYIFDEDVKFVDESGNTRDKSNKLSRLLPENELGEDYLYSNKDNSINTYFPNELQSEKGIVLSSDKVSLEIYPEDYGTGEVMLTEQKKATYGSAFGTDAKLEYEATFSGFKENIVLYDASVNEFDFILETDAGLKKENGTVYFVDKQSGETIGNFSPVFVYDSSKDNSTPWQQHFSYDNSLNYEELSDGRYRVTISADRAFLEDSDTVYPVYVDPTVTITANTSGTKKIVDTPIYNGSGMSGVSAGADTTALLGYADSSKGAGRLLVKLPGLFTSSYLSSSYNGNCTIELAELHFKELSGKSGSTSAVAFYHTGNNWSESSVYSSNLWNSLGMSVGSHFFPAQGAAMSDITIPITIAVRNWLTNTTSRSKGLIIKNSRTESNYDYTKVLNTSECSLKPYVRLKYFYNGCRSADLSSNTGKNCIAYALKLPLIIPANCPYGEADYFPQLSPYQSTLNDPNTSVSQALYITAGALAQKLNDAFPNKWRGVSSYDSYLYDDEWLVCMRVGKSIAGVFDYHFWYRASDGKWYNKHGPHVPECVGNTVVDPLIIPPDCNGWAGDNLNYTSDILYYALKN